MNIAFWNTNKKSVDDIIIPLILENNIDVMILIEYSGDYKHIVEELMNHGNIYAWKKSIASKRFTIIYKKKIKYDIGFDADRYTSFVISDDINIVAVHYPSKHNYPLEDERGMISELIAEQIEDKDRVLLIGDFNCNPFESPLVGIRELNALPIRNEIKERTVLGRKSRILYNPMWNLLGDFENIPGTHYFNNSQSINYYWNMFDQIIITQDLVKRLVDIKIIKQIGGTKLITSHKKIKRIYSDHLPIMCELED